MELQLNPTRHFAHRGNLAEPGAGSPESHYLIDPQCSARLKALSLNGDDNVLPEGAIESAMAAHWASLTAGYVGGFLELLIDAFSGVSAGRLIVDVRGWVLRQCEVYWELACEDAPAVARQLSNDLLALSQAGSSARRAEQLIRVDRNQVSTHVHLGAKNVHLGIYAKTDDRLRLEVRHSKNFRATYPQASLSRLPNNDLNDLRAALSFLMEKSAERANQVVTSYFRSGPVRPTMTTDLAYLLTQLSAACGTDSFLTHRIVRTLILNGRLVPTDPKLEAVLDVLVLRGILQRVNVTLNAREPVYVPARPYAPAFRALGSAVSEHPVLRDRASRTS